MITKRWTDIVLLWRYKRHLYLNGKSPATEENLMGKPVLIHLILILFVFFRVIILYFFPKVLRPSLVLIKTRSCWRWEEYCWIKTTKCVIVWQTVCVGVLRLLQVLAYAARRSSRIRPQVRRGLRCHSAALGCCFKTFVSHCAATTQNAFTSHQRPLRILCKTL